MTEATYVSTGLADDVADALEAILRDEDRRSSPTHKKASTFRRQ
jgi:hypothetical protein